MSDDISLDFSNYKDRVGGRVPPGRYRVVVDDTEADKSSAGNLMINVWLRIQGGEFDGTVIIDRLTQTEKALFRTVNFMQSIGLPTPRKKMRVNIRSWVGKTLEIDVEDGEPYLGRVKSEVRGYNKIPKAAGGTAAADLDGLDEFAGEDAENNPPAPSIDPDTATAEDPWAMPVTDEAEVGGLDEPVDLDSINLG
jgi:hypothetical protein